MNDKCPKCGAKRQPGDAECPQCGVIYAKVERKNDYARQAKMAEARSKADAIVHRIKTEKKPIPSLTICPTCKKEISKNAIICPHCGEPLKGMPRIPRDLGMYVGILGAIMIGLGVFTPIASMPMMGSVNLLSGGMSIKLATVIIIALAALATASTRRYRPLLGIGVVSAILIGIEFYSFGKKIDTIKHQASNDQEGNPFKFMADSVTQNIQFEWGWAVLIIGAAAIIAGAVIGIRRQASDKWRV